MKHVTSSSLMAGKVGKRDASETKKTPQRTRDTTVPENDPRRSRRSPRSTSVTSSMIHRPLEAQVFASTESKRFQMVKECYQAAMYNCWFWWNKGLGFLQVRLGRDKTCTETPETSDGWLRTAMNLPWYWYASKLPRQIEIRPMMSNRQTIAKRTKSLHAYRSLELHHLALNLLTSCRKPLSGGSHTGLLVFVWYLGKGMQGIKVLLDCSEDASILPRFQNIPKTGSKGVFKKVFGDLWSTKYCLICHFGRPCLLKYELYLNIFI